MSYRPKVLALAPYCDGTDVGEAWCAFQWVKELSKQADVTLLSMERPKRKPLASQLPDMRVITRPEPTWTLKHERLNAMAKLSYPTYHRWAKKQIHELLKTGEQFDIAHQFSPIALRFASPLRHFDVPYVLGPRGGSLSTPEVFRQECETAAWYTRFRKLDSLLLRFSPWLKASYKKASAVLGVAPYVQGLMKDCDLQQFELMSELGIAQVHPPRSEKFNRKGLRLLHVGRGVRTKGLRDLIRALVHVKDIEGLHLDIAGKGPEMAVCETLAKKLDVAHLVTFHGQIDRQEVDTLYTEADVFVFPSFREPSGSVVYEALSHGVPSIVADRGGPGYVVDDTCGFRVAVTEPQDFSLQIANAIRTLAGMPELRRRLSEGAIRKMEEIAHWPSKIEALLALYQSIEKNSNKGKEKPCQKKPKSSQLRQVAGTGFSC